MRINVLHKILFQLIIISFWATQDLNAQVNPDQKSDSYKKLIQDLIYEDEPREYKDGSLPGFENLICKIDLAKRWSFKIGDNERWASPYYDDRDWEEIKVPSKWENEGFNGYNGYAWYRMHFDGRLLDQNQTHFLFLGIIDDVDETYLNGKLVGKSGKFPPKHRTAFDWNRQYYFPSRIINFKGDNVISVRVYDYVREGGIISGKPGIYASSKNENLLQDLYGEWKFKTQDIPAASKIEYDDSTWKEILVPARWDNQGYRSFDGTAWYRKHFELSFKPNNKKNYYLLLGKIDDYDVTYLNGKQIGVTSRQMDFKYNFKEAWQTLRIYKIPEGLLRKTGTNILAVRVTDRNGPGGIYLGPIGIVAEEDLPKVFEK